MKIRPIFIFALFICGAAFFLANIRFNSRPAADFLRAKPAPAPVDKNVYPQKGPMVYDIKLGGLNLGTAVLLQSEAVQIDGKLLNLVVFQADAARFKDTERIYADPVTMLPVRIDREVKNWFNHERITEDYDQENYTVTITKRKNGGLDKAVVKKDGPIHNAILLPFYVRNMGELALGHIVTANLPNGKFRIDLVSVEDVSVPAGVFKAYHFESSPKRIEIWVSADEQRIPLKIQGIGLFSYLLVLQKAGG